MIEIIGVTSTEMSLSVAFVYLKAKREDNFSWCLDSLKSLMHGRLMPPVIVSDRDLMLVNAVKRLFPAFRHFLCRWHIGKILLVNARKPLTPKRKSQNEI